MGKVWLSIKNLQTRIVRATDDERLWLREYLQFSDTTRRHRAKDGSNAVSMLNVFSDTFPTGLLPVVLTAAEREGIPIETQDGRVVPCTADTNADLGWLYPYQRRAVDIIVGAKRGILWCPTGSGKTEIAIGVTRALPTQWLFLVHRANLAEQARKRYEQRSPGLRAGFIGEGTWDVPDGTSFVCATFQTIAARLKQGDTRTIELVENAKALMVDECHTLPSDTYWRVSMQAKNAYFRVGLSATPLARGDRKTLLAIASLGPVVYRIKTQSLIKKGKLAKPTVRVVEMQHGVVHKPTWQGVYSEAIVRNTQRNNKIVRIAVRAAKPGFLFVTQVKHGKLLEKMLWKAGVKAKFVWGAQAPQAREALVRQLVLGQYDVLVTSVVFQEGIDVPELRSVIVGSGGKSIIAALQRIGRGMRVDRNADGSVADGGDTFEVWDIEDIGCGCKVHSEQGMHNGCKWLEAHTKIRTHAYAAEEYETFAVQLIT